MTNISKVSHVSLFKIHPAWENDTLYQPVNPSTPENVALRDSIAAGGILEPLVLSEDLYILSGHRRYSAALCAGLQGAPCQIKHGVHHGDPEFLRLLREYNRQRVKSVDEILRECLVDATEGDEDAIDAVLLERDRRSEIDSDPMAIVGTKTRKKISEAKAPFLAAILRVIEEQREFWPLSDRMIHYRLLNDPPLIHAKKSVIYRNDSKSYSSLCELLTRARLEGSIPWTAIADPTRPVTNWDVHPNVTPFIQDQMAEFMKGYRRNFQQSQPHHIEILGEKNTVASIIRPVAMEFHIPFTIGRGFSSLQPRYDLARRYHASGKDKLVILILSDHDPDGEEIAQSFARSMRDDFEIADVHPVKVALNRDQVEDLALIPLMQAKKGSSNYEKFVSQHGNNVFELEAVPPKTLQKFLREAILSVLDVDLMNREIEQERADILGLQEMRKKMLDAAS